MKIRSILLITIALCISELAFAADATEPASSVNATDIAATINNNVPAPESAVSEPVIQSEITQSPPALVNVSDLGAELNASSSVQKAVAEEEAEEEAKKKTKKMSEMILLSTLVASWLLCIASYFKAKSKFKPSIRFLTVRWQKGASRTCFIAPFIPVCIIVLFIPTTATVEIMDSMRLILIISSIIIALPIARIFTVQLLGYIYDKEQRILNVPHMLFFRKEINVDEILDISQWTTTTKETEKGHTTTFQTFSLNITTQDYVHEASFGSSKQCDRLAAILSSAAQDR